jgi:endonuclease YncB( thermonuclease family)
MRSFTPRCAVPLLALLLVTTIAHAQDSFTGKVVSVTDGDTIQVMHNGKGQKVRLWGIDTPEKTQAFGTKAGYLSERLRVEGVRAILRRVAP